ncbi:MAG: hypothetical protein ACOYL5_10595 [Phototrophicaceae bacterium]|jgi:hypothetical protein
MTTRTITIELPEETLQKLEAAHIDLQSKVEALVEELIEHQEATDTTKHLQEVEAIFSKYLSPEQVTQAMEDHKAGKRVLGLYAGLISYTDDFADPLPDDFWGF